MNTIILPYKNGSRSGAALANALGVRQIRLAGSSIHRQRSKTIINWGNSGSNLPPQGLGSGHYVLNPTVLVSDAADKLRTFNVLGSSNTRIPEYTTEYEIAYDWMDEDSSVKVVERHQLSGHSGAGIVIAEDVDALSDSAPLYVKYIKKQDEYRIHIMDGQVIDVQRKARRSDVPDEDVNWQVRNHQNGFCYMRENVNPDTDVVVQALNAIEALGLDFGAVDVIWNAHQNKAYVLEVNTACGLEGTTLERYKVAFQELLTLGEVTPLEGYELGEGDEDDEPLYDSFDYAVVSSEASDETYALDAVTPVQEVNPTFQVGDSVRVVGLEYTSHPRGTVGEVVDVRAHGCQVRANGTVLFHRNPWLESVQTPARELQVGDRVMISPSSGYYTQEAHNPAGVLGTVIELRAGYSLPFRVQWDNNCRNTYSPPDLVFMGEEDNTPEETAPRQELTPETLRVGMRLRALVNQLEGTILGDGAFLTVTSIEGRNFYAREDGLSNDYVFYIHNLTNFELVDDGVVQQEQVSSDITPSSAPLSKWLVAVDGNVNLEEGVFDTQEDAEMALVSSDFHNMRQLGHDVRVVSL